MLNEKRVKHMVKLAFYETTDGKEELKASSYYKKDYITFHILWSSIWVTIAYVLLMVVLGITFMRPLLEKASIVSVVIIGIAVVLLYIGLLITYIRVSKHISKQKHAKAYYHVKQFKSDLSELTAIYEEEDTDGEVI